MNIELLANITLLFGLIISVFYGLRAVRIFMFPYPDKEPLEHTKSWMIHQVWINFWGSFVGWICIYLLMTSFGNNLSESIKDIKNGHVLLFIVGLLGTMGFLPRTLWGIANSAEFVRQTVEKALGKKIDSRS